jgi:hypothetical protein
VNECKPLLSGAAHFLAVFAVDLALFSSTVTLVSVRPILVAPKPAH